MHMTAPRHVVAHAVYPGSRDYQWTKRATTSRYAADLFGARFEDEEAFAIGMRFHLPDLVQIDDGRAVDALELARIEAAFEILHRFAQDQQLSPV